MTVFFDSNVYVSAVCFGGAASKAIEATRAARLKVYYSPEVLVEVRRVIRERIGRPASIAERARSLIADLAEPVNARPSKHRVPGDPDDTAILNAALAAGADYLVTRDAHLLSLRQVESLRVITLAEYLELLRDRGFPAPT